MSGDMRAWAILPAPIKDTFPKRPFSSSEEKKRKLLLRGAARADTALRPAIRLMDIIMVIVYC